MTLRKLLLGTAVALATISPAHALKIHSACFPNCTDEQISVLAEEYATLEMFHGGCTAVFKMPLNSRLAFDGLRIKAENDEATYVAFSNKLAKLRDETVDRWLSSGKGQWCFDTYKMLLKKEAELPEGGWRP